MIDTQMFHSEEASTTLPYAALTGINPKASTNKAVAAATHALSVKQKERLFQVLANQDRIVVHTSQNKVRS